MRFNVVVPRSIFGGWRWKIGPLTVLFLYHSLQCDQRWLFAFIVGHRRIAYRTHGDADESLLTYGDGGWWWPWQTSRTFSGRGW